MKLKIITLSMVLASSLFAGGNTVPPEVKVIEIPKVKEVSTSAFYFGLGASYLKLNDSTTKEKLTGLGATAQIGYSYNDYIGIEARYTQSVGKVAYDKGTTTNTNNSNYPSKASNIAIYAKPNYKLGNLSLYGLVGYGMLKYTNLPTTTRDRKQNGFQWGVGTEYSLVAGLSIFADYTRLYTGTGFDGHVPNSDVYSDSVTVGVSYRF